MLSQTASQGLRSISRNSQSWILLPLQTVRTGIHRIECCYVGMISPISPLTGNIVTVRPIPIIYGTSDILLLVDPLWLPARTRVHLIEEAEQTQHVLEHISEFYGLDLPKYSKLPWASEPRQGSRKKDVRWEMGHFMSVHTEDCRGNIKKDRA